MVVTAIFNSLITKMIYGLYERTTPTFATGKNRKHLFTFGHPIMECFILCKVSLVIK